jgi:hypothetical protein
MMLLRDSESCNSSDSSAEGSEVCISVGIPGKKKVWTTRIHQLHFEHDLLRGFASKRKSFLNRLVFEPAHRHGMLDDRTSSIKSVRFVLAKITKL